MSYDFNLSLTNEFESGNIVVTGDFEGIVHQGTTDFPPKTLPSRTCTFVMVLPSTVFVPTWLSIDITGGTYVLKILDNRVLQLKITNSSDSTTNVRLSDRQ